MKSHFRSSAPKNASPSQSTTRSRAIRAIPIFHPINAQLRIERSTKTMPNTRGLLDTNQRFTLIFVDKTTAKHLPPPDDEENVLDLKI